MLTAINLSVTFDGKTKRIILNNVSFTIEPGRITTFIGSSGTGKTTLLRCIAQLTKNYTGNIKLNGALLQTLSPRAEASAIGFVFQNFNLFPHLTALDNCALPLRVIQKMTPVAAKAKASEMLASLGMLDYATRYPSQLSGGQQQRVAIARALCQGPKILLLDEPTSALDPANVANLVMLLQLLCKQGIAIAVSSQDMTLVRMIVDRVYLLEAGQIVESFDKEKDKQLSEKSKIYSFLSYKPIT